MSEWTCRGPKNGTLSIHLDLECPSTIELYLWLFTMREALCMSFDTPLCLGAGFPRPATPELRAIPSQYLGK